MNRSFINIILKVFFFFFFATSIFSQTPAGTFLKLGVGGRGTAMGYAFIPVVDDASSPYWNPAGLSKIKNTCFILSFNKWFADIQHGYAGAAIPTGVGTFGLGVIYLTTGNMIRTEAKPGGNGYLKNGEFSNKDLAAIFSYGITLPGVLDGIGIGGSLKYINQTLDDKTGNAFAFDLGVNTKYQFISLAAVVKNIGTKITFIDEEYGLPMQILLGGALNFFDNIATISVSAELTDSKKFQMSGGLELQPIQFIALRTGYRSGYDDLTGDLKGLTAGIGLNLKNIRLDYSFNGFGDLGHVHQVSLAYSVQTN